MTGSGELSVASTVALILGGIAAFVLALVVALGGYGRPKQAPTVVSAEPAHSSAPAASAEVPAADIEYPLDTTEPATAAGTRP